MRIVIIYASVHHGNTKKIVEAMASVVSVDLINVTKNEELDLSEYNVIGFASGIYFNTLHKKIRNTSRKQSLQKNIEYSWYVLMVVGIEIIRKG